jgi:hypothetical protein
VASRKSKVEDIVFQGVVIPRDTRSARLAKKGITTTDEMADFLTAVFSDTLKGKIILPSPQPSNRPSRKVMDGSEQKLKRGLPVTIQSTGSVAEGTHKPKPKLSKKEGNPR